MKTAVPPFRVTTAICQECNWEILPEESVSIVQLDWDWRYNDISNLTHAQNSLITAWRDERETRAIHTRCAEDLVKQLSGVYEGSR